MKTHNEVWNTSDFILNISGAFLTKIVCRISLHTVKGFHVLLASYRENVSDVFQHPDVMALQRLVERIHFTEQSTGHKAFTQSLLFNFYA